MAKKKTTSPVLDCPFLSIRNCVPVTGLSERYLRRLLRDGELPHIMSGSRVLVNVHQLLELMDKKTTTKAELEQAS